MDKIYYILIIAGYYIYAFIFGTLLAYIFGRFLSSHDYLRWAVILLNIPNIIFYIAVFKFANEHKMSKKDVFNCAWHGKFIDI